MTQLGLNIFGILNFLNFFGIFENRKIKYGNRKISNLNRLVENINNPRQRRQKLVVQIRQVYQIVYQVIK